MNGGPSATELTWTISAFVLLIVSLWQWRVSVGDYKTKREQAQYRNGDAHAGMRLAHFLSYTILLDCLILFAWAVAGSLSVVRHYVQSLDHLPPATLLSLLFLALYSFGARVILRAVTRVYVNRL